MNQTPKHQLRITIESGIPIPALGSRKPRGEFRQALESLEAGQSILVEGKERRTACSTIVTTAKTKGMKFVTRSIGPNSFRVWRTA